MSVQAALLPADVVERFRRDGFVVIPDLLTPDEVARYGQLVTDAVHTRTAGDDRPLAERSPYQQSFLQCMNLWEDFPDVRPLTFHPRLGQAAAELLGVDADPGLARPGPVQEGRRPPDRRPPGPRLLADQGDRIGHRVDPVRGLDDRVGGDGLPPGQPPDRAAQVRQHLRGRARRTSSPTPRSPASSRCSSRSRRARWPSTTG